jgi:hypothetical protein
MCSDLEDFYTAHFHPEELFIYFLNLLSYIILHKFAQNSIFLNEHSNSL